MEVTMGYRDGVPEPAALRPGSGWAQHRGRSPMTRESWASRWGVSG